MIRRLMSALGLVLLVHAAGLVAKRPAGVRLVEVTSESTAASQSVLITATEPASYTVLQPDPLTVLITIRDVTADDVTGWPRPALDDPVGAVEVLDGVDDEGNSVAQVRIGLREPTVYEVRSRRQTIQVRFARPVASTPTPVAEDATAASSMVGRSRPATAIVSVETLVEPRALSVTLRGNGALAPGRVHEAEHLPPRLVIDFPHLAAEAAPVTPVEVDPVKQVRVAPNSAELTRVVFDLVRPAEYYIEQVDGNDRVLRVVFPRDRAIDPVAQIGGVPASETAIEWQADTALLPPASVGPPMSGEGAVAPVADVEPFDVTTLAPHPRSPEPEPEAVTVDGSPVVYPDLADIPRPVWEGQEIVRLDESPPVTVATAPVLMRTPSDLPLSVDWPEIRDLPSAVVALAPDAPPLLSPAPSDLPLLVDWPEIRDLPSAVVALAPEAPPLLSPAPSDLPLLVDWPEIRDLPSAVVALAPEAPPLLSPAPSDLPLLVDWPEIRDLPSAVVALAPDAPPLLSPAPSDLPLLVDWPEIRDLPSAVVALAPEAPPLLSPAPSDLPLSVDWPEIPRLATATPLLDQGGASLMHPEPLALSSQVDTTLQSATPLGAVADVSTSEAEPRTTAVAVVVAPAAVEVAMAVEPSAVAVPAVGEELAVGMTLMPSEPVAAPELGERPIAPPRASERVVPLRSAGRPTARASRAAMQLTGQPAGAQQEYTGDPLSMDFQGADLRAVLRIFASDEVSGLNIVIDPSVQGEVNVALTEVPWDQAFDIILRANGLAYEVDGTVVRIASLQKLSDEAQARRQLQEQEALAGELVLFTRTLSYARAADVEALLRSTTLSSRGEVFTDPRTNTLIIRDLEDRLAAVGDLLDTLDRAEPQVEIEARIVQASHSSARALGVQWGVTGRVAQEIGNTLPFSFPNRGGITGRAGAPDGQGPSGLDSRALPDENAATAVDLGVDAATSAIGLTLAAVNGALNLDVVLSALESQGELRIISSPRVMTQNNVAAEILQGDQIPYQTVANNTVTVQFKEAALTLRVTPQITASDTVIMQVELENSFPDFGNALGDPPIPPIVTQRAQTTVQVEDGATAVIGGIFENTQAERSNRTPGLSRIPLLGWLFKSTDRSESTDELMIFLTPRIVR